MPYDEKTPLSQIKHAGAIASSSSLPELTHSITIKAKREGLLNATHVFRSLQENPEEKAKEYRLAAVAAKKPCKYFFLFLWESIASNLRRT